MSSPRLFRRFACPCFVIVAAGWAGCASTYPAEDTPPPKDFSGGAASLDMTIGVGGSGGSGGPGGGTVDLAAPSQASIVDMAVKMGPPDLMPSCVASIADDGGVAPGLHLAAPGPSHALYAARFNGTTWSEIPTGAGGQVSDVALTTVGDRARPLVLARMSDAHLDGALYDRCSGAYAPLAPIRDDSWTALRPAIIADGNGADAVFRGAFDQKLYWSRFDGSSWGAVATDGNLISDQIPSALLSAGGVVHSVYNNVGKSQAIYDGTLQASGGLATALAGTSNFAPAAVTVGNEVYVVFTGTDTHVYWFKASSPGSVSDLCNGQSGCYVLAEAAPSLSPSADGGLVAIYRGTDHHLYSTSLAAGAGIWSAVLPVSGTSETTTLAVALAPGIGGATAEAVYVRAGDGYPRHARLSGGVWQVSTVAAVALTGAAALAVSR